MDSVMSRIDFPFSQIYEVSRFPDGIPLGRSSLLALPGQVQQLLTLAGQKCDWSTS